LKDLIDIYDSERKCEYRGENYLVRDNGSILRKQKPNKRKRPLDEKWTFGNPCKKRGYMNFSSETVHRIVATAFHGEQPSSKHIVDHIDTNKRNNRPENLRWVTRLENILLNDITLSRIIYKYGSIDNFLDDPLNPLDGNFEKNFEWMRTVTKEESENTKNNLIKWAKEGKITKGGQLGEWIYNNYNVIGEEKEETQVINYILSKTPNAAQEIVFHNDKPNEFPCTPEVINNDPLQTYFGNLKKGNVFFRNHNGEYVVVNSGFSKDKKSILILTRANYVYREQNDGDFSSIPISELKEEINTLDLPHSLSEVSFKENLFIHARVETGFHPREELEEIFDEYTEDVQ
jgi:hypothetical protein